VHPATASPRYALTEAALRLLRHTEIRLAGTSLTNLRRRINASPMGITTEPSQWRQESAFFRIVSITESYLDSLSTERFIQNVNVAIEALNRLVEDVEISSTANWRSRESAFKFHHGLDLSKCSQWKELQASIQVRNCLAHGLGRLTARQRRNSGLAKQVALLHVTIGSGRMYFGPDTLPTTAAACRVFVSDVDGRMPI
jgi:hypothetical protein